MSAFSHTASTAEPIEVLLDLQLPTRDGLEVPETITDDPRLRRLPVVILTGSDAIDEIARCYEARANAYLTKPTDLAGFVSPNRSSASGSRRRCFPRRRTDGNRERRRSPLK